MKVRTFAGGWGNVVDQALIHASVK